MYICPECGSTFSEPSVYGEVHTELDDRPVEYFSCCPNCGEGGFEEALCCDYCENWFCTDDLIGGTLCRDCLEELAEQRKDIVKAFIMADAEAFAEYAHDYLDQEKKGDQP